MSVDFKTNIINGIPIFSLEEEENNRSICIDTILKKERIDFDNLQGENLNEKMGAIGDLLLNVKQTAGSLIWSYLKNPNTNTSGNLEIYVKNELNRKFLLLKNQSIISLYQVNRVYTLKDTLYIEMKINNSDLLNLPIKL